MTNAEWIIKTGKTFSEIISTTYGEGQYLVGFPGKVTLMVNEESDAIAVKAWLDLEHREPVLDKVERKYLDYVIAPFRGRVQFIMKEAFNAHSEKIVIRTEIDTVHLPRFIAGRMYKGMEQGKRYTLQELGL